MHRVDLGGAEAAVDPPSDDLLALDEALEKMDRTDEPKAGLVRLRYFGGLTNEEAAEALSISPTTTRRWWRYARAWLLREIDSGAPWGAPRSRPTTATENRWPSWLLRLRIVWSRANRGDRPMDRAYSGATSPRWATGTDRK